MILYVIVFGCEKRDECYIEWQKVTTSGTTSDNGWQRMATSDNDWCNKWQRVTMRNTTSDDEGLESTVAKSIQK